MALFVDLVALTTEIPLHKFVTQLDWKNDNVVQSGERVVVVEGGADVTQCEIIAGN